MVIDKSAKRLLIYFFYDKDGIVDRYVLKVLEDIKENVSKIYFVSNGKLAKGQAKKIDSLTDVIIERENKGMDVYAYKRALEEEGFENLKEFDEVILMNFTIMGPVYPSKIMFDEMTNRDLDFWGLTKYFRVPFAPFPNMDTSYLPEHLQSHFIVVRKKMLASKAFKDYWQDMPEIKSYTDSVVYHESQFMRHFNKLGYKSDAYVQADHLEIYTKYPLMYMPKTLIKDYKCPYFKRRAFFHDYCDTLLNTAGQTTYEMMEYLKNETDYDTDLIYENIIRCYHMDDIRSSLALDYVLPSKTVNNKKGINKNKKVALVFHAYFPDLIEDTFRYVNNMPAFADVYITTNTPKKKELLENRFKDNKFNKFKVILIKNRGRDVSALLVATKSFIMDYDYVCFAHDKKVGQIDRKSVGAGFAYLCLENVLGSEEYVYNVLDLFEKNPRLGLLTPPPPVHAEYFMGIGSAWGPNYEITRLVADRLGLNVPMSEDVTPVAPIGTVFWFRPAGMKKLFDYGWKYEDFPKEPNRTDGTILHAIERIYCLVEQDAGFYSAWCTTDYFASIYTTSVFNMLRGYAKNSYDAENINYYSEIIKKEKFILKSNYALNYVLDCASRFYPNGISDGVNSRTVKFYFDEGNGLDEEDVIKKIVKCNGKEFSLQVDFENLVSTVRFDPTEERMVFVEHLKLSLLYDDGAEKEVDLSLCTTNGVRYSNNSFFFDKPDPQITISTQNKNICGIRVSGKINCNLDVERFIELTKKYSIKEDTAVAEASVNFAGRILRKAKRILKRVLDKA